MKRFTNIKSYELNKEEFWDKIMLKYKLFAR